MGSWYVCTYACMCVSMQLGTCSILDAYHMVLRAPKNEVVDLRDEMARLTETVDIFFFQPLRASQHLGH